ncbi:hypothetical protein GCM10009565_12730 [Amycolatopsis albidoflavus]
MRGVSGGLAGLSGGLGVEVLAARGAVLLERNAGLLVGRQGCLTIWCCCGCPAPGVLVGGAGFPAVNGAGLGVAVLSARQVVLVERRAEFPAGYRSG